jgi:hypothetical protein
MNIKNFFKNIFRKNRYKRTLVIENNSSVAPINNTITVVRKNDTYSWAKFKCPCGCHKNITLSLTPNIKPNWDIKFNNDNKVTLSPSINLTDFPCKSHFFIKNNKINWV